MAINDVAPKGAESKGWIWESINRPLLTELTLAGAYCSWDPHDVGLNGIIPPTAHSDQASITCASYTHVILRRL
jgi:hypothetical protein